MREGVEGRGGHVRCVVGSTAQGRYENAAARQVHARLRVLLGGNWLALGVDGLGLSKRALLDRHCAPGSVCRGHRKRLVHGRRSGVGDAMKVEIIGRSAFRPY